jgi:translocation and assembly module TamB
MSNKRDRRQRENRVGGDSPIDDAPAAPPHGMRRRRVPVFTLTATGLLLLIVALAPTILSFTPLGPQLVASAAREWLDGTLAAESVSMGWLSGQRIHGVSIRDRSGSEIASAESVVVGKSLLGLIFDRSNLGVVTIQKPRLLLVARNDRSNLEDLLAPLMSGSSSGDAPLMLIQVNDGYVKFVDDSTGKSWDLAPVVVQATSPRTGQPAWNVAAQARLGDAGANAQLAQVMGDAWSTAVSIEADRFPLEPLQPIVARMFGPLRMTGAMTGKIDMEVAQGGAQQKYAFDHVDAIDVHLAAPYFLGEETLDLEHASAHGTAEYAEGLWRFSGLEFESDVGSFSGSGDLRLSEFSRASLVGGKLPTTTCDFRGVVELARLSRMLPHTFHLRDGVEFTSGQANVSLVSKPEGKRRRLEASLTAENVAAISEGRPIGLRSPIRFRAAVLDTAGGWQVERLVAESSFLSADAAGNASQGELRFRGNLNRLAEEAEQFFDLGEVELSGEIDGMLTWQGDGTSAYRVRGEAHLAHFSVAMPGMLPWREDELTAVFDGQGVAWSDEDIAIERGRLRVASGGDQLDFQLQPSTSEGAPAGLALELRGDLATWLPRVQTILPLHDLRAAGSIVASGKGTWSPERLELTRANMQLSELAAGGLGFHIREPEVRGETSLVFDRSAGILKTRDLILQSRTAAMSSEELTLTLTETPSLEGSIAARLNVARALASLAEPSIAASSQWTGEMEAEATFQHAAGTTQATLTGQVNDLAYATRALAADAAWHAPLRDVAMNTPFVTQWEEPLVSFRASAAYDAPRDLLTLMRLETQAGSSGMVASGKVAEASGRCLVDLSGEVRYDLAAWRDKLQPLMGPSFDVQGAGVKPFDLRGPLFAASASGEKSLVPLALTGKGAVAWQRLEWMALPLGPADVSTQLRDSTFFIEPTTIALNHGSLRLAPAIVLRGDVWHIAHGKGRVIENAVITPEMCRAWIKYISPLVADATAAQGKFSVDVDQAMIPLEAPTTLAAQGSLQVQQVTVGPGPLALQLIAIAEQVRDVVEGKAGIDGLIALASSQALPQPAGEARTWLELPEQAVPVYVVDGKVHHQQLTMQVRDVTLRTSGAVGLEDESLELMCEIPIRDEWLSRRPQLASLKGQTLKIPIRGTISRPELDLRALPQLGRDLAVAAGRGAIQSQIGEALNGGTGALRSEAEKGQEAIKEELNKARQKLGDELRRGLFGR